MAKQVSPFAALSGAEKQIRWLEYQSIRLPYVHSSIDDAAEKTQDAIPTIDIKKNSIEKPERKLPEPPPEVPRILPSDYQKTRHGQYDAVIARLKQAEMQSRQSMSHPSQQGK